MPPWPGREKCWHLPPCPWREAAGAPTALGFVDELELTDYPLFHSIRADLLRRLGRNAEAAVAYESAIALTQNAAEREFLERRRLALG